MTDDLNDTIYVLVHALTTTRHNQEQTIWKEMAFQNWPSHNISVTLDLQPIGTIT